MSEYQYQNTDKIQAFERYWYDWEVTTIPYR